MTHARRKHSLCQFHGERRDHVEGWSHVDTVGGARPVPSMRAGKAKKDVMKKIKAKVLKQTETWMLSNGRSQDLPKLKKSKKDVTKRIKCKTQRRQRAELSRKLYPLRGRSGPESEALSCHVLLTRLDVLEECEVNTDTGLHDKTSLKTKTHKVFAQEPRKRRLASLNAEAVNSLLLEKTESGAKRSKKHRDGAIAPEQTKTWPNSKQSSETCEKATTQEKSVSEVNVFTPTPRRVAGLNAVALMRLTSSTTAHKHRIKTDRKAACLSGKDDVHRKSKVQKSKKQNRRGSGVTDVCEVCESRSFEWKRKLEESPQTKPAYRSCSMLGYPLNIVKEEQVETDVSSYYCCPSEGSVEYCHRLALFLRQKEHAMTSVKHECLIPLSAHPCLCADPCYSGYYVHIAHAAPAAATLSFCPRAELLSSSHSLLCNSPCFHETFIDRRSCSYSSSCSRCTRPIKTEGFPSSQEEQSRASAVSSAPLGVNSSSAGVPRLISTPSERRHTHKRLKRCPQNTKAPNTSLAMSQTRLSQKHPTAGGKQKKVDQRQVTNGWRPVGEPTEKEVFIAGDDETVLRQCYEGVERDGEVIRVRDTVLLRSGPRKKSLPYVAKISCLWVEPRTGELMMSLFWYYRPEHTQGGRDPSMHCENEIFASRHQDENSVACIEDRCYVLPSAQYCRFCALVKRRSEGVSGGVPVVPDPSDSLTPPHRLVPDDVDPDLVYLCRHVYDFKHGRILKNLQ
ncbi:bromo adjacent homology domain-containing 1 protein [Triplophysa rosa]|uniref:Bromo adjacent homology domain-containing 1 protein-like n=1 Tax=Triplophysa rosa TaxID=992332 RepID=A0A9W7WJP8_TRIRA|nr:bromo adjacent homology domain-containing 1 protein [Triplophysa rosa]KAI7799818.1 putative bromo adjacent homology domain-containing 1 protein-like [Triplophysa rosa]